MSEEEVAQLKNKAKYQVRKLIHNWIKDDWEMKRTMLIISDGLVRGVIDKKDVDSAFKRRLVSHIASNEFSQDKITQSTVFYELLQEVFLEEMKALQN